MQKTFLSSRLLPPQRRLLLFAACLFGLYAVLSLGIFLLIDKGGGATALSFFGGGLIHIVASLGQGLYYFAYRGAQDTHKMVAALGWGLAFKFLTIIFLASALMFLVAQLDPLALVGGIVLMQLLHIFGTPLFLR